MINPQQKRKVGLKNKSPKTTMKTIYNFLRAPGLGFYFITILTLLFIESEIYIPRLISSNTTVNQTSPNNVTSNSASLSPEDLNVYKDRMYLPDPSEITIKDDNPAKNDNETLKEQVVVWKNDADRLWKSFDTIQTNCSKSFYKISVPLFGVSSSILHVINVVWRHWMMDKAVVIDPKSNFKWESSSSNNNKKRKGGGGVIWPSLLKPLDQTCIQQQHVSISPVDQYPKDVVNVWDHKDLPDGHLWDASIESSMTVESMDSSSTLSMKGPSNNYGEWFRRQYGDLIFSAVVTAYFMKPSLLQRQSKDCIAVHIRRGDSCGKGDGYQQKGYERSCPPFQTFFEGAYQMKQKYGWDDVFVATDSPDMDTILSVAKEYGFTNVRYQRMDRNKYNTTKLIDNRIKTIANNGEAAYEVYTDIQELISCKGLVGPLHSTMDMLVLQLLVYRQGKIVPFISVDDPWCPEFGGNNFCPSYKRSCKCVDIPQ